MMKSYSFVSARQTGSTLVMSLLILVLIMILGVTAMTTSNTQFKLAGNVQFQDGAMNSAETAIATAEEWLSTGTASPNYKNTGFTTFTSTTGYLHPIGHLATLSSPNNDPLLMEWGDSNSIAVSGNTNQRYMIEQISLNSRLQGSNLGLGDRRSSGCNQVNTYLITARGLSARGATKFIQSYFSVLSC